MPTLHDQAICLRLMDWSETSQIAVLFTREHGKVSATARGAKRTQPSTLARYSGGLELLTFGEASWISKRNTELANMTGWDLQNPHWHIRNSLRSFQIAMYVADLLHHLLADHDPHPELFEYTATLLDGLGQKETRDLELLNYQWTLLTELGYQPALDRDVKTGQPLESSRDGTYLFSPHDGGTTQVPDPKAWRTRIATIELLRAIQQNNTPTQPEAQNVERANKLICAYLREILHQHLPTMKLFLEDPTSI